MLDAGMIDGKRVRKSFPSKEEAEGEGARLRAELRRAGDRVAAVTPEERARWLALEDRCRAAHGTIEDAVEFWLASRPTADTPPLSTLLPRWDEAKEGRRGSRHRDQVRLHWKDFVDDVERWRGMDIPATEATAADVMRHMERPEWSAGTRRARLASLSCVFGWAARQRLVASNVVSLVHRPELPIVDEIRFATVEEARALLTRAWEMGPANRDLVVYLVLGMFAGVRRSEIQRTRGGDFHLASGEFVVPLGKLSANITAKRRTRKRRVVDLEITALEWLRACEVERWKPDELIIRPNWRRRWERVQAVIQPWPENVLRHTFPTYHFALYRNEARLQSLIGHDSANTLREHYLGLVRREQAEAFWALRPSAFRLTEKPDLSES
jgi:integrase